MKGLTKELGRTLKILKVSPMEIMDKVMSVCKNEYVIDVVRLDELMISRQGYNIEKDGSLSDFITKKAGKKGMRLIHSSL